MQVAYRMFVACMEAGLSCEQDAETTKQREQERQRLKHEDNSLIFIRFGKLLSFTCVGGDFLKQ